MKRETNSWVVYAEENVKSAQLLLQNGLYNPCLQNIQQAVEKYLKALIIEKAIGLSKTHSIRQLNNELKANAFMIDISDDEIDLIDSIYLPSKYPAFSALPNFNPDEKICRECLDICDRVKSSVEKYLGLIS